MFIVVVLAVASILPCSWQHDSADKAQFFRRDRIANGGGSELEQPRVGRGAPDRWYPGKNVGKVADAAGDAAATGIWLAKLATIAWVVFVVAVPLLFLAWVVSLFFGRG